MLIKRTLLQLNKIQQFAIKYVSTNPLSSDPIIQPPSNPINSGHTLQSSATTMNVAEGVYEQITTTDLNRMVKLEHVQAIQESEPIYKSEPFDSIPGPKSLRYLSKFWSIFPVVSMHATASTITYLLNTGSQLVTSRSSWFLSKMFDQYGPVVCLHTPFGGDVVVVSRGEHVGEVFINEGRYPMQSCLDCLEQYHTQYRKYKYERPLPMYEAKYEKLPIGVEELLNTSNLSNFEMLRDICDEFVTRISRIRNRQLEVPSYFRDEIQKWSLECLIFAAVNKRIGFLDSARLDSTSEPSQLLQAVQKATTAIRHCESGIHLWKFFNTPAWYSLVQNCDVLGSMLSTYICEIQNSLQRKKGESENLSLVETLFVKEGLLPEDVLTVLFDMILVGVNALSHSVAFLMYNFSQNPKTQQKLYDEIKQSRAMNMNDVSKIKYLKACIRESFRLYPPMPILSRVLSKDISLDNYLIPKGTKILVATHMCSRREEHFDDAHLFRPGRWLEDNLLDSEYNTTTMPFGYVANSCLALNLVEMQIATLFVKLIQKFRIEYHYGEIRSKHSIMSEPNRSLEFRFIERN